MQSRSWQEGISLGVAERRGGELEGESQLNCISASEDEGVSWMKVVKEDLILPWVGKRSKYVLKFYNLIFRIMVIIWSKHCLVF